MDIRDEVRQLLDDDPVEDLLEQLNKAICLEIDRMLRWQGGSKWTT